MSRAASRAPLRATLPCITDENAGEMIRQLVAAGADVEAEDEGAKGPGGCTPLFLAALVGSDRAVQALLDAGARPSHFNEGGHQPLHMAAGWSSKGSVIRLLLDAGAAPNAIITPEDAASPDVRGAHYPNSRS